MILKRLTPTFPSVIPMQWRAAKQDYLIRHHDPATAAQAMQHSLITTLRKYSNGSEVTQQLEMATYFSQVEKIVLNQRQENIGFETNSVGICTCPGKPKMVAERLPITPNCKDIEGCLFCDKYRVHVDEVDTRKILSARYYIKKVSRLANNQEEYLGLFFTTLQRIDFILGELKRRIPEVVDKITLEVDIDAELDAFWFGKLEMLMELDLA